MKKLGQGRAPKTQDVPLRDYTGLTRATFEPMARACKLLDTIARGGRVSSAEAREAMNHWLSMLAPPDLRARVETHDDLEVDDRGAGMSQADDGTWVQAWVWVPNA